MNYNSHIHHILFSLYNILYESPCYWLLNVFCSMESVWVGQNGIIDHTQLVSFEKIILTKYYGPTLLDNYYINELNTFYQSKLVHGRELYFNCKSVKDEMEKCFLKFRDSVNNFDSLWGSERRHRRQFLFCKVTLILVVFHMIYFIHIRSPMLLCV